jgi:2-dehydro-3-deoxy-D-arabinonate dehydratase
MHLYKTAKGIVLRKDEASFLLQHDWNDLVNRSDLFDYLLQLIHEAEKLDTDECDDLINNYVLPPIHTQEVWAAGVTYLKSRDARMEESKDTGGADCYQKVYDAERPELFFKAMPYRVAGTGQQVFIRKDSSWNVPEPELTLYINASGNITAYTIGNDMSSRSIEGENPLYLPQAKMYERSAAIGPCLFVTKEVIDPETMIRMTIYRNGVSMYAGETPISRMKRSLSELAAYLYRALDFEDGCFLMTGTCLVPPSDFTLKENDVVEISIDGIGTLVNTIGLK